MTSPSPARTRRAARAVRAALAAAAVLTVLAAGQAEARAGRGGGGGGFGSRGARTFETPQATPTAPRPAAPIERSATTPGQAQPGAAPGLQRPLAGQAARGGMFSGMRGGFLGGLLGAGLIGMLLGHGFLGGLGGLLSILGLVLQVGLVVLLVGWAVRAWQRRQQPATAGGPALNRDAATAAGGPAHRGAARGATAAGTAAARDGVGIGQADLDEFERLLGQVQAAYGRGDEAGLREACTPEMAGYFGQELAGDAAKGVANHVRDVRLLQGDLAEAWREGATEYATVAMRFSLVDHTVDRATGRTVEGDPERPVEATEVWTFARPRGGKWQLSAIQQA